MTRRLAFVVLWLFTIGVVFAPAREVAAEVGPQSPSELETLALGYPAGPPRVPIGYDPAPKIPALGVKLPRIDGPGFSVRITNQSPVPIDRLRYVAIVEQVGWRTPVRVIHSMTWDLSLAHGETTFISSDWLNRDALDQLSASAPAKTQIFLAPSYVRYADGSEWNVKIDPTATSSVGALVLSRP